MSEGDGMDCPVCGRREAAVCGSGSDYLSLSGEKFDMYRCASCGFVFLPAAETKEDLYAPAYYRKMRGFSRLLELLFLRGRRRALEKHKASGRLLDVGCGTGEFLRAMAAAGWSASGVEPSQSASPAAGGLDIRGGQLSGAEFPAGSLDAVTMWQVLEHLPDPAAELVRIKDLLKDDGVLLVSVPNIASWQAAFGKGLWFHLDLPRHRWQFSPETLRLLLEKAGYRVLETDHFSLEYGPYGWWQTLFNRSGCEVNFAYRLLKRGTLGPSSGAGRRAYTALFTVVMALPFLAAAFVLSALEGLFGRGGVIAVVAVKK